MKLKNTKYKIVAVTVATGIFLFSGVMPAFAQFGIPTETIELEGPLLTAAISTAASAGAINAQLGVIQTTIGVPGAAGVALNVGDNLAACQGIQKSVEIAGSADNFSSFSLIGGSPAEATQITTKLAALIAVKNCDDAKLQAYKATPILNLIMGQELARKEEVLNAEINSLNTRIEALKQRQSMTYKDVLKAVALKLVLNFSKQLTTKMVNSIIAKYRIGNFMQYADAVSTQIYTSDYVKNNYPNSADQLIARSILQNNVVQGQVLPMVRQEADSNLGFIPSELDVSDPDYYAKLAMVGKPEAFGPSLQVIKEAQADLAKAQGNTMAQQEISQGKGFVPVRNCNGAVDQQKSIDNQRDQLNQQYRLALEVQQRLQAANTAQPGSVTAADLKQASDDLKKANDALSKLPVDVSEPILTMCEAISNPAAFVGDTVANTIQENIAQGLNVKDQNLPFYATFIEGLVGNLLNNVIEGGNSNLKLLTESGFKASNILANDLSNGLTEQKQLQDVNSTIENEQNTLAQATQSGVTFKAAKSSSAANFDLAWDATGNANVDFVTLTGVSGLPNTVGSEAVLTGKTGKVTAVRPNVAGTYTYILNLYAKNKIPGQDAPIARITLQVPLGGSSSQIVAGAFTTKLPLIIRSSTGIHPRGN